MNELLENYILADGTIISISLGLEYHFASNSPVRQATIQLAVRKRLSPTKWAPCQVQLQFQQLCRINIFEDFSSASYSDIVLTQLPDTTWYLSLDPFGNTSEPHEQDNLIIMANQLTLKEVLQPKTVDATQDKLLVERYIEAYNRFDMRGMLACLHPEVRFEHSTNGDVTVRLESKEAFESQAIRAAAWFAERTQRIMNLHWQDGQVEAAIDYHAVTATDLPNGVKAGTTLQFSGRSRFSFRDGLIAFIQDFS